MIAEVAPGQAHHIDVNVINGATHAYEVRVVDGPHEVGEVVERGSSQDLERTAFELRNTNQVSGWFDPTDDSVDFNDFFLFANHFGTIDGQPGYDPLYDLSPNNVIDFDYFFIFADNFGWRLVD